MIALGIVVGACMVVVVLWVKRYTDLLLNSGEAEGPGDSGPDPMDGPGDGLSPYDFFLRELPAAPVDNGLDRTVAAGQ